MVSSHETATDRKDAAALKVTHAQQLRGNNHNARRAIAYLGVLQLGEVDEHTCLTRGRVVEKWLWRAGASARSNPGN